MDTLEIHDKINKRLDAFIKNNNIPHIIFHGPSGGGKRTLIHSFINKIYDNNKDIKKNMLCVLIVLMEKELNLFVKN